MAQSLFGITDPALMQQAIQQEQEKMLMQRAMLSPAQRQSLYAMRAGQQLGGVVNSLFGNAPVTDPRLQQAQLAQEAYQEALGLAGGDAASPQFFEAFATTAAQRNLPQLAQQAAAQAAQLKSEMAQTFQRTAAGQASLASAAREQVAKQEAPLTIADRARLTQLQREFGEEEGAIKFRQERDEAERRRAAAGAPAQTPTEKAVLPGKAKLLGDVESGAIQATKTLQTANALDRVLSSAFTGFGSDARLRVGQLAAALGATVTGVSETEQLKQLLAQLTQGQARSLPGALSEKELMFLREAIGTGNFTLGTLQSVVKRLRTDALTSEIENEKAQQFVLQNGDLNRYDFAKARKDAQTEANRRIAEQEAKQRRLQELRKKQGAR
jgi:hypothetical protein